MSERLARLGAIVRTDVLVRMRRPSTVIVFLLLSAVPYLWIPEVSTGRTLLQVDGRRALYNSASIGMGTAMIGALFIGLFGFYVISNALRRDVTSRCGFVIASTTMRGSEYIAGKFAGNVAFLTLFTLGFMATSMAMVIVRGEASLEPLVFAKQYLLLLPPAITFVSAIAIVFECTPLLRTKLGDVFYFFLWVGLIGSVAATVEKSLGAGWAPWFDVSGMGFVLQQMKFYYNTTSLSIGASTFDPAKAPLVFPGLQMGMEWILPRLGATLWPVSMLAIARLFFHRFDPARVKAVSSKDGTSWIGRFNRLARPFARLVVAPLQAIVVHLPGSSLLRSSATDAVTTLAAFPLAALAVIGFAIASLTSSASSLFTGVMPIAWAVCAVALADIACREKRGGTSAMIFAAPGLRSRFVRWKFLTASLVAAAFLAIPIARGIALRPAAALPLIAGFFFTVAASTALGVVSANPKTYIVGFLTFWYIVINERGQGSPTMDFAGWFGAATPAVAATYATIAVALLVVAQLHHQWELRRRW